MDAYYGFELIRSDAGDGGWSLHAPELADDDGLSPALASGPAQLVDGEWDRPNALDYAEAEAVWINRRSCRELAADQAELDRRLDERDRDPYGDGGP